MRGDEYYSETILRGLFGVSRQRLYYWRKIGLIPDYVSNGFRGYTFADLLSAKVVIGLVNHGVRANKIRDAVDSLKKSFPDLKNPLTEKTLFLNGKEICVLEKGKAYEVLTGQMIIFQIGDFEKELKSDLKVYKRDARQSLKKEIVKKSLAGIK